MKRRDLLSLGLASLATSALTPRFAIAQGKYPERPIKLMVAFSAGGVNDVVARQWAERVKLLLGTVYVENQGGGSGTIATGEVARALPDGYTILLGSTSTMVLNPMTMAKVPYEPARDFVPIAVLAVSTTSIVVHESLPVKTLKELIAYAKANPGKLSYGSAGSGTMSNLSGELFKQLTGLNDLVHIPYKGAGPGITDLVSGHIPMMSPNVTAQILELHRAGKIRILAKLGDNAAIAFILQLLLLQLLFGGNALGLFPLQKCRHRDQQAKHQQDHDFGHGQPENQALPVRRALLQYLPVHDQTLYRGIICRGLSHSRTPRRNAPSQPCAFPAIAG